MDSFFLSNWFYEGMKWFHDSLIGGGSFVWTIALFTLLLKLVLIPTDIRQRRSSQRMAELNPELEKLKKKYASDPKKMQEMQSALYKKHGVSMFSSCLPLLLTMPIFIAFLGAMRIWANEATIRMVLDLNNGSTEVFESFRWLWVNNIFRPDTGLAEVIMPVAEFQALNFDTFTMFSSEQIALVKSLAPNYETIVMPVLELFKSGVSATGEATYYMNGWFILPLLAGATNYLSSWVQKKLQPATQQAMGKGMTLVMVGISVFVCIQSNAAFAIYWIVSNIFTIGLQFVMAKIYNKKNDDALKLAEGGAK